MIFLHFFSRTEQPLDCLFIRVADQFLVILVYQVFFASEVLWRDRVIFMLYAIYGFYHGTKMSLRIYTAW